MGQGKVDHGSGSKGNLRSDYRMRWTEIHMEVGSCRGLTTERAKAEALGSSTIADQRFIPARSRTGLSPGPLCGQSKTRPACGCRDQAECGSSAQAEKVGRAWVGPRRLEPFSAQRLQPAVACWEAQGRAARTPVGEHRSSSTRHAHRTCTPFGHSGVWAARPDWTERERTSASFRISHKWQHCEPQLALSKNKMTSLLILAPARLVLSTADLVWGKTAWHGKGQTANAHQLSHQLNGSRWDFGVQVLYKLDPAFLRLTQLNCKWFDDTCPCFLFSACPSLQTCD